MSNLKTARERQCPVQQDFSNLTTFTEFMAVDVLSTYETNISITPFVFQYIVSAIVRNIKWLLGSSTGLNVINNA